MSLLQLYIFFIIFSAIGYKVLYMQTKETGPFLPQLTRMLTWDDNEKKWDRLKIWKTNFSFIKASFYFLFKQF